MAAPQDSLLDAKLQKALGMRTDAPEMLEALEALNDFFERGDAQADGSGGSGGGNTLEARRNLRGDLELQNAAIAREFLAALAPVKARLEGLRDAVGEVNDTADDVLRRLRAVDGANAAFTARATQLLADERACLARAEEADAFLARYRLSAHEQHVLESIPIGSEGGEFFGALLSDASQPAAAELLDALVAQQRAAFDRLFQWVRANSARLDSFEPSPVFRAAISALRQRPAFYNAIRDDLVGSREALVVKRFVLALTRGQGAQQPIELSAHDPTRYAGDMLAWVHQAIASERELAAGLLGEEAGEEALPGVFAGVAAPLRVRLGQILMASPNMAVAFRLLHLMLFYHETLEALLGAQCAVVEAVRGAADECRRVFDEALAAHRAKLEGAPPYATDLAPSHATLETVSRVTEIITAHRGSMVDPAARPPLEPVLDAFLEPLLRMCAASAQGLDQSDTFVLLLNNATAVQAALERFPDEGAEWTARLGEHVARWRDGLVAEQADRLLSQCGVSAALARLEAGAGAGSAVEGLPDVLRRFYALLFGLALPQFDLVVQPAVRNATRAALARAIADAYRRLHGLASAVPAPGVEEALVHSPEQVEALLDL